MRINFNSKILLAATAMSLSLAACSGESNDAPPAEKGENIAKAKLMGADGAEYGEVIAAEGDGGLLIQIKAINMSPGMHGAHIHTTGKCEGPDFKSAGGHWNPTEKEHGLENPKGAHMGDMMNLEIAEDGTGMLETQVAGGVVKGGENPLLDGDGAAFIVHAGPDDMKTDPAGDSGGRVACGVFEGY